MTKIEIAFCDGTCVACETDKSFEEEYKSIVNNTWTYFIKNHFVFARDKVVYVKEITEAVR